MCDVLMGRSLTGVFRLQFAMFCLLSHLLINLHAKCSTLAVLERADIDNKVEKIHKTIWQIREKGKHQHGERLRMVLREEQLGSNRNTEPQRQRHFPHITIMHIQYSLTPCSRCPISISFLHVLNLLHNSALMRHNADNIYSMSLPPYVSTMY